jgi:hypothetical protein
LAAAVLAVARQLRLILVLDGLEVAQEGPASDAYGRLLDGALREVYDRRGPSGARVNGGVDHRFPFADLTGSTAPSARMLEVPPFTLAEGAALSRAARPHTPTLTELQRRDLVGQVDGHALASPRSPPCSWSILRPPPPIYPSRCARARCHPRQGQRVLTF